MASKTLTFALYLCLLTSLLAPSACKDNESSPNPPSPTNESATFATHRVTEEPIRSQIDIMGTVESTEKAIIAARINGHIIELNATLGSRVGNGDELLKISAEEISAKLLQTTAQLNQADRNLKRERKLLSKNAATPEGVKSQEDAYKIAQASHKEALSLLSYTTVRAPFDGIITKKLVNIGDLATPGKPLLHLENDQQLRIVTDVPEAMVLKMNLNDKIQVTIPAAETTLTGTVNEIAPASDPLTRTTTVKIILPQDENLRSGQFARVHLTHTKTPVLFIPQKALSRYGQMERVYLLDNGVARMRLVRSGRRLDEKVEILSGLNKGDRVLLSGDSPVRDGQRIEMRQ